MKKIIITTAIVCAAAFAQATAVFWGGAINPDDDYNVVGGQQYALLWSATELASEVTKLDKFSVGGKTNVGGEIVQVYSLTNEDIDSYAFGIQWPNTAKSADGYYAILALSNDGKNVSYLDMGNISGSRPTDPTKEKLFNYDWSDEGFITMGGYNVAIGNIPEPTTGLLILMGMAGLALKRKVA